MASITMRLPDELSERLNHLAQTTNRSKTFYLKDMLLKYLEEYESAYLALERLTTPDAKYYTTKELKEQLGI